MALVVTPLFGGKFTLQAVITTSTIADTAEVGVPAAVEDYWIRRMGFTPGTPGATDIATLIAAGVLDLVTYIKQAGGGGWDIGTSAITYAPGNAAGARLFFTVTTSGSGVAGAVQFYAKLTHTIQR